MNFSTLLPAVRSVAVFVSVRAAIIFSVLVLMATYARAAETATISVGGNITLVVSSDGSPAPTFQWRKNGAVLAGATGVTYSISSALSGDAGSYRVTATNEMGSADSPDFVLTVNSGPTVPNTSPVITSQPVQPTTATTGASVSLVVAASGSPAPTYQWLKNGVAIGGWTDSTLNLVGLTTNDNGAYVAIATNAAGSVTSSSVTLTVTPAGSPPPPPPVSTAPVFTAQPMANQSVAVGATVSFSAAVSGSPAPALQWRKNGVVIGGATAATLTLSGVTTGDSGSFTVTASNSAGTVASDTAVLMVVAPPTLPPVTPPTTPPPTTPPAPTTPPPTNNPLPVTPPTTGGQAQVPVFLMQPAPLQTAVAGATVSLSVSVSGVPSPSLQWRKNGVAVVGATNSMLTISGVTPGDAATYSVLATNTAGTAVSGAAALIVNSRPVFVSQPAAQAVPVGARATFSVSVSAIPGASLQWMKNGVAIPSATKAVFTIDATAVADYAQYSVLATNTLGSATSAEVALVVAAPPVFTTQPAGQTVGARADVTFSVTATGAPAPIFQWKKNGLNIGGATGATLQLRNVDKADEANYTVEATNSVGWAVSSRAALVVNSISGQTAGDAGAPPPSALTSVASKIVNLSVRASAGGAGNSLIVGFVVSGNDTKPVLVRGIGPALSLFGVPGVVSDPTMALYSGAAIRAENDDWRTNPNSTQIVTTSARVGAFGLPEGSADAAILSLLDSGAYTVQIAAKGAENGAALAEVYDAAQENSASLVNLSVRTNVGGGVEAPTLGFVIGGTGAKRILIRAVGPTLSIFGVPSVLADPQIELYKAGTRIDQNDNWGGAAAFVETFAKVGAFAFADPASRDAALLVTLEPGAYTVHVSAVSESSGVALVEIYDVP